MSPEDIYCSSIRVCPFFPPCMSVRPSVCPCVTQPLSEPYLPEPFMVFLNFINNMPTEVVQQKIKIQFCQILLKFWPKTHFLNVCFVKARFWYYKT